MLQTARLHLRPPVPADAPALSALMTPAVSACLARWPVPFTPADALARIAEAQAFAAANTTLAFVVHDSEGPAGWCSVHRTKADSRRGVMGYWLGETRQRRGYGREFTPALLTHAFHALDLHTIEASAQPGNAPSLALFRRMGMAFVGERMEPVPARGAPELVVCYAVRRPA